MKSKKKYNVLRYFYRKIVKFTIKKKLAKDFLLDKKRYFFYSRTFNTDSKEKLIGAIILQYHVIEKGLTMPEMRKGFGQDKIISLCQTCEQYYEKYGMEEQLKSAIMIINEYKYIHDIEGYVLSDKVLYNIKKIRQITGITIKSEQNLIESANYFESSRNNFLAFSNSRRSVRDFSKDDLPLEGILKAIELAKNAPSACNRQSWRTYVFTSIDDISNILEEQGGNKGFGCLVNKLIVISTELGVFSSGNERNQAYIDGGIYLLNLLYSLHFYKIATCTLNCGFDREKEKKVRKLTKINDSEVLIAMIACGNPSSKFKIATSPRYSILNTNVVL